jgi:hypothetical protein
MKYANALNASERQRIRAAIGGRLFRHVEWQQHCALLCHARGFDGQGFRAQVKQKAFTSSTNIEARSRTLQAPNTMLGKSQAMALSL